MHFKSTLIVCAVYFLSSAWSNGLTGDQLTRLSEVFKDYKITIDQVDQKKLGQIIEESFGIRYDEPESFGYTLGQPDSMNLVNLLRNLPYRLNACSYNIDSDNTFQVKRLRTIDVTVFLDEFVQHIISNDQPGYLTFEQLSKLFKDWKTFNKALNAKIKELKLKNDVNYVMNAVDFLLMMMEIKPAGGGLTLAQLEKFDSLYENRNTQTGSIDPAASEEVFKELGLTTEELSELKPLFDSSDSAATLLVDLIVAAAERNKMVAENDITAFCLTEVITTMMTFKHIDSNHDGVLSPNEYDGFMEDVISYLSEESVKATEKGQNYIKKFDNEDKTLNFAKYMEIVLLCTKYIIPQSCCPKDSSQS
ncbi:uncharacterized protein LOC126847755 [Adelges cooleyi]|uniref:uncharacterized protein LOC126847755 n=1 Tax=Adelges cooleyi TaxID=133065 RepID=UPI002180299C|nr:uncharacterized protein LOC126847755 [Adelges cooleyi]